jgi:hypothetical protein
LGFHVAGGASLLPSGTGCFPPSRGQQATQFTRLAERISDGWRTWTTPSEGCGKPFRLRRGRALCWWILVDAGGKSRVKGAADRLVQGKPLRRKGQGRPALALQERASFQLAAIISRAQVLWCSRPQAKWRQLRPLKTTPLQFPHLGNHKTRHRARGCWRWRYCIQVHLGATCRMRSDPAPCHNRFIHWRWAEPIGYKTSIPMRAPDAF